MLRYRNQVKQAIIVKNETHCERKRGTHLLSSPTENIPFVQMQMNKQIKIRHTQCEFNNEFALILKLVLCQRIKPFKI